MNAMILAAGKGSRLLPFTAILPKPCIPFLSVPLGAFSLSLIDHLKINRLVVNTHYLPEQVEAFFRSQHASCKELCFTFEPELLGPGGGIHNAENLLKGDGHFLVLNADELILPHHLGLLEDMLAFHKWHKGIATLLTMDHPDVGTKFGGAWLKEGTKIQLFSRTNPGSPALKGQHFTGVLLLSDRVFSFFKPKINDQVVDENILYETLTAAIQAGEEVHAFNCKAEWYETGTPDDFMKATEACLQILSRPQSINQKPFWRQYLSQTICLFSQEQYVVEKQWARLPELQTVIGKVRRGQL